MFLMFTLTSFLLWKRQNISVNGSVTKGRHLLVGLVYCSSIILIIISEKQKNIFLNYNIVSD